ncbi:hypothetical protein IIA15_07810 [candidate division TA06 bacterium]|nr:hypothetical protein [candidate division TA06 bacterium]
MDKMNFGDPNFREDEIDYQGFRILIMRKKMLDDGTLNEGINFYIYDQNSNEIFHLLSHFTHVQRTIEEQKSPQFNPLEIAGERGLELVKAMILLKRYPESGESIYRPLESKERIQSDISDDEIEISLLEALFTIRRNNPESESYRFELFPVDGFCEVLGITLKQYSFSAGVLDEKGKIDKGITVGGGIEGGQIWITLNGIEELKEIKKRRPKKLLEVKKSYGDWEVVKLNISKGGQAKIHKVRNNRTGVDGALKEIIPKSKKKISRFRKEIESLKRLKHEFIVQILDSSVQ